MTEPEVMLWSRLRRRYEGAPNFRRQHAVGPYILDFYCAAARLAVEIDGAIHGEDHQLAHDARRDAWLKAQGITVYRTNASSVFKQAGQVADAVRTMADNLVAELALAPSTIGSSADGPPPPSSSRRWRQT